MTATDRRPAISRAVDAAIASATVYPNAEPDERVGFGRVELAEVVRLYKSEATRAQTFQIVQERFGDALDAAVAKYGNDKEATKERKEWRAVLGAHWLTRRLEKVADVTYTQTPAGSLAVRARRTLGEDFLG